MLKFSLKKDFFFNRKENLWRKIKDFFGILVFKCNFQNLNLNLKNYLTPKVPNIAFNPNHLWPSFEFDYNWNERNAKSSGWFHQPYMDETFWGQNHSCTKQMLGGYLILLIINNRWTWNIFRVRGPIGSSFIIILFLLYSYIYYLFI